MSSGFPSSSNTPPRRVVLPALPVLAGVARSRAPTPPTPSPLPEKEAVTGDLGLLAVGNSSIRPGTYLYTLSPLNSGAIEGARLRIQGF